VSGILKWGDIGLLAGLASCPLEVRSLVNASGKALSAKQCSDWKKEVGQLVKQSEGAGR